MPKQMLRSLGGLLVALAVIVLPARAGTTKLIYSFTGGAGDEYPDTELVMDASSNLYGTTVQGGQFGSGTVFQLTPSSSGWIHKVLYDFQGGADGGEPYKGVTLDAHGDLYGTTVAGGLQVGPCIDTGCGVVYKLTKSGQSWKQSIIHSFVGGSDGYGPGSRVTLDGVGNVYGTTPTGGTQGAGVVYQLQPATTGAWTERVIHTFTGGADGSGGSAGRLVLTRAGNVYGVCTTGGAFAAGTVFKLTPTPAGEWYEITLYSFKGEPDSGFPYGAIVSDQNGNLYGTTYYAGAHDRGSVYRLSRRNGVWNESWIYSFHGGTDGSGPISTLVADAAGNLYGTTSAGGAGCNCGTIFKLTPNDTGATYGVVYRFQGPPDGASPYDGMAADSSGSILYGATVNGGTGGDGAIYQFTP